MALVLLGLAIYLGLFFRSPLPTLEEKTHTAWRRTDLFLYLVQPTALTDIWFGVPPEFSLADRLPVLGGAIRVLVLAGLAGWCLLVPLGVTRRADRLEQVVLAMAIGLNLVSTWTLLVGWIGRLTPLYAFVLPLVVVSIAAVWLWRTERRLAGPPGERPALEIPNLRILLVLAAPFVLAVLLGGMLPPVDFDVREYHLQAPKEFYQLGRIDFLPHNVYANMALGTEMLSLSGMVVMGDWWLGALVGKTVIACYAPLGALAIFAVGRRMFSPAAGAIAGLLYLSTGWVLQVSTQGLVEGASALYLLLAVYGVWAAGQERSPFASPTAALFFAGYAAGAGVAAKYPAVLFVVLPLTAWIAWKFWRPGGRVRPVVFLLACFLGCGLWFIKNAVVTGNPTYPLLYGLFDGNTWTPEKAALWKSVHSPDGFTIAKLLRDAGRVLLGSDWLGPLLVPLAALAFLSPDRRRLKLALAAMFAWTIAAWWCFALRIDRYWIPALPLLALLAGDGAFWSSDLRWRRVLLALLALTSLYNLLVATGGPGGPNFYFVRLDRLRDSPEVLDPWQRYFNRLPEAKVLLVGEAQAFDFQPPVLYNTWIDDPILRRLTEGKTPAEVRATLGSEGITHVYVQWGEVERYRQSRYGNWDWLDPAWFDRMVAAGVLVELPRFENHPGHGYRVASASTPRS